MNSNRFAYTVVSWNVRGLGHHEKCDEPSPFLTPTSSVSKSRSWKTSTTSSSSANLSSPYLSCFAFTPAAGSRGGLITAWNPAVVAAGDPTQSEYTLSIPFTSTTSDYSFYLNNVYAPSDHRDTDSFLSDLLAIAPPPSVNWVTVGDFNPTRSPSDRNTDGFNRGLAIKFNATIDDLAWIEFPLLDRLYTWSNKRLTPTLARLDRVFVNNAFSTVFPYATLSSRLGSTSDHVPLILNIPTAVPKSNRFCFENSWLKILPSSRPLLAPGLTLGFPRMLLEASPPGSKCSGGQLKFGLAIILGLRMFTLTHPL